MKKCLTQKENDPIMLSVNAQKVGGPVNDKNYFFLTVAVVIFLLLCPFAFAQSYQWQPLSPNDAIQAVRAFENNPNLAVTVTWQPPQPLSSPDPQSGYKLTAGRYEYMVCAYTPKLIFRDDALFLRAQDQFYGQTPDPNVLAPQAMSENAALAIAQAFMTAHYPAPQIITKFLASSQLAGKSYLTDADFIESYNFTFWQDCGGGTVGPSFCDIEVDTIKGMVVSYAGSYFPVLISPVPSLTKDQAMAALLNQLQVPDGVPEHVSGPCVTKPDAFGAQQLVYTLRFGGTVPTGVAGYAEYSADVDANTGALISLDELLGLSDKPAHRSPKFEALRSQMAKSIVVRA